MEEAWVEFMVTGKVQDYLNYKQIVREDAKKAAKNSLQEERPDGTKYYSDRNGLTSYADRRL